MSGRMSFTVRRMSNLTVLVIALLVATLLGHMSSAPFAIAGKSKILNFFLHETLHDRLRNPVDPSAFNILPPLAGFSLNPNASSFGSMSVFDDSMTVSPNDTSLEIGRSRGFFLFDENATTTAGLEFSFTAEFNEASGFLSGSTLLFKGFDRILAPVREIAIIGGTGEFRLARGWAVITTYSYTETGIGKLNFTAHFHYGF